MASCGLEDAASELLADIDDAFTEMSSGAAKASLDAAEARSNAEAALKVARQYQSSGGGLDCGRSGSGCVGSVVSPPRFDGSVGGSPGTSVSKASVGSSGVSVAERVRNVGLESATKSEAQSSPSTRSPSSRIPTYSASTPITNILMRGMTPNGQQKQQGLSADTRSPGAPDSASKPSWFGTYDGSSNNHTSAAGILSNTDADDVLTLTLQLETLRAQLQAEKDAHAKTKALLKTAQEQLASVEQDTTPPPPEPVQDENLQQQHQQLQQQHQNLQQQQNQQQNTQKLLKTELEQYRQRCQAAEEDAALALQIARASDEEKEKTDQWLRTSLHHIEILKTEMLRAGLPLPTDGINLIPPAKQPNTPIVSGKADVDNAENHQQDLAGDSTAGALTSAAVVYGGTNDSMMMMDDADASLTTVGTPLPARGFGGGTILAVTDDDDDDDDEATDHRRRLVLPPTSANSSTVVVAGILKKDSSIGAQTNQRPDENNMEVKDASKDMVIAGRELLQRKKGSTMTKRVVDLSRAKEARKKLEDKLKQDEEQFDADSKNLDPYNSEQAKHSADQKAHDELSTSSPSAKAGVGTFYYHKDVDGIKRVGVSLGRDRIHLTSSTCEAMLTTLRDSGRRLKLGSTFVLTASTPSKARNPALLNGDHETVADLDGASDNRDGKNEEGVGGKGSKQSNMERITASYCSAVEAKIHHQADECRQLEALVEFLERKVVNPDMQTATPLATN